jgi:hypothetical protein
MVDLLWATAGGKSIVDDLVNTQPAVAQQNAQMLESQIRGARNAYPMMYGIVPNKPRLLDRNKPWSPLGARNLLMTIAETQLRKEAP